MLDIGVARIDLIRGVLVVSCGYQSEIINALAWQNSILAECGSKKPPDISRVSENWGKRTFGHEKYKNLVVAMLTWDCSDLVEEVGSC